MKHLMPALEARYAANPELVRIGRALSRPTDEAPENLPGSYVVTDGRMVETIDDFAGDTERWEVEFTLIGKSVRPNDADIWLKEMERSFEDADLVSPDASFECPGTKWLECSGPTLQGHMYIATCRVEVYMTLTLNNPFFRGR